MVIARHIYGIYSINTMYKRAPLEQSNGSFTSEQAQLKENGHSQKSQGWSAQDMYRINELHIRRVYDTSCIRCGKLAFVW